MKEIILKHALKNALDFNGKANPKVVLGQVIREKPELKKDIPSLSKKIEEVILTINTLKIDQIKDKLQTIAPEFLQVQETTSEGPLKPLPHAEKGKVVVRIAPSPSGALHVGHAYGASINYEYAKMYDGKLILRIEDTNPENIYEPAYKLIEEDTQWLAENNVSQVIVQSDRLGIYYDYAEQLIQKERAYVCTCNPDVWREMKNNAQACPCRTLPTKEQALRYAKMFNEYAEGEAVLRIKTNIADKNPAMRDFAVMRINEHVHPKTGKEQRVWPLMIFAVAIDDHELGITHVLNGKDHADNAKKEALIMKLLGWESPEYKHWGRINFEGMPLSASKTKIAIEQKEYQGWEDIRLPFLPALRRRGYQPEAFRKFAVEVGLSINDKTVGKEEFWKMINAFNRDCVEPTANRYFFIDNPVEITIEGAPEKEVLINLHPDFPARGKRTLNAKGKVLLSKNDVKRLREGEIHRLMDYCNVMIKNRTWVFVSESYEEYRNAKNKGLIIHWLPLQKNLPKVDVVLEDNLIISGFGEEALSCLKEKTIVQFERNYFVSLDKKEKNHFTFWYLHK